MGYLPPFASGFLRGGLVSQPAPIGPCVSVVYLNKGRTLGQCSHDPARGVRVPAPGDTFWDSIVGGRACMIVFAERGQEGRLPSSVASAGPLGPNSPELLVLDTTCCMSPLDMRSCTLYFSLTVPLCFVVSVWQRLAGVPDIVLILSQLMGTTATVIFPGTKYISACCGVVAVAAGVAVKVRR